MVRRVWPAALALLVSPDAFAQTGADAQTGAADQPAAAAPAQTGDRGPSLEDRLRALEEENARQKAENAAQAAELEALGQRLDASEEAQARGEEGASSEFEPSFHVYGFMDLTLQKWFTNEESMWVAAFQDNLSFMFTGVNVYMQSNITQSLSALVELRFTFLPLGAEKTIVPYEREDTHVSDPQSKEEVAIGGVVIERAHMTWQPIDAFGVTAGRYLTPYGIWNIDHGSPVVLSTALPFLLLSDMIQGAQTGLQIHGRFFPRESLMLDYAVTFSNGRGPTEEIMDLDDHKAVGLRLRLTYDRKDVRFSLGGYAYAGKMTDTVKGYAELGTANFEVTDVESYHEYSGAGDLLLELYGVRLQSEFAGGYLRYDVRPVRIMPFVGIASPDGEKQPDHLRWSNYSILAWTLPLRRWLGDMTLTPWVGYEYWVGDDSSKDFDVAMWRFGINFKPNAAVAVKLDGCVADLPHSPYDIETGYMIAAQVAVAF